jgi:rod shape-determining protein MreC
LQVILLLVSFLLIFVGKVDLYTVRATKTTISEVVAPIYDIIAAPVRAFDTMASGMRTLASFRAENVRLRAENERLKRWQRRAEILESENRQLKTALGAVSTTDLSPVTARAISAPGGSFAHSLLLDIDTTDGVARGNAVVNANGLVGYVIEVGRKYARVLLITDVNSKIPVLLSSSSWPGLALGQNSKVLRLDFLPLEAIPKIGELVLTSGHGGILPPGIPLGRVISIEDGTVLIEPSVALEQVSFVSVLTREENALVDFNYDDLESFFAPLPAEAEGRLLEGVNAAELLK